MAKTLISLDEQQIQRLEQIVLDHDEGRAIKFLEELSRKMKSGQAGCNPLEIKAKEIIDDVIDKANNLRLK